MAQLFETLCMMLAFKESHSLAMHYCKLVWDVRSLSKVIFLSQYLYPSDKNQSSPHNEIPYDPRDPNLF